MMIDAAIRLGMVFDWFSPLRGMAEEFIGGMQTLLIDPCGHTCNQVKALLHEQEIRTGAGLVVNDTFMLTVDDPERATAILQQHGIEVENGPAHPEQGVPDFRDKDEEFDYFWERAADTLDAFGVFNDTF